MDLELINQRAALVADLFQNSHSEEELRELLETNCRGGDYGPDMQLRSRLAVTDEVLDGKKWYRISGKPPVSAGKTKRVLYLHGGNWVLETGPHQRLFASFLAEQTGAEVWFPEYPLGPEYHCTDSYEMLIKLYEKLLSEATADEIALAGDSAGGSIALGLAMYLKEKKLPQPNNLILLSPVPYIPLVFAPEDQAFLDMMSANGVPTLNFKNQKIIESWWQGPLEENNYLVNPVFGDLRDLAPMTIFVGSGESLITQRLCVNAAKQRVKIRYWEKRNAPHVWVTRDDLENAEERALIVELLRNPDK